MLFIRSTAFNVLLALWTGVISALFTPTLLTCNTSIIAYLGTVWSRVALIMLKLLCNVRYELVGIEHLPKTQCIIVCKHQSMWETIFLMQLLDRPVFILKKELTRIPVYGWSLIVMGMICIDRAAGISALRKIIKETKRAFVQRRSIVIFPEGTRSKPGEKPKIQSGIVAIHEALPEIPIVPVSLDSGKLWPKNSWLRYPGVVHVKIGAPISKISGGRAELLEEISKGINDI